MVASGKLEECLTAGKVIAADKPLSDPYASYGTEVPRVVLGSKQYWKSFGYDLVAMTEQLGIPDFFVTLSPNDNWPQIQSTIKKGWGQVLILKNLQICHADLRMKNQLVSIL